MPQDADAQLTTPLCPARKPIMRTLAIGPNKSSDLVNPLQTTSRNVRQMKYASLP